MITFHKKYAFLTVLIFLIEVVIALFVRDRFIRPYFGDVLVVILLYCFIRSFTTLPVVAVALGVLTFSFTIEWLQYLDVVEKLGLEKSNLARTVIGTSFSWNDMLAYLAGFAIILLVESKWTSVMLKKNYE